MRFEAFGSLELGFFMECFYTSYCAQKAILNKKFFRFDQIFVFCNLYAISSFMNTKKQKNIYLLEKKSTTLIFKNIVKHIGKFLIKQKIQLNCLDRLLTKFLLSCSHNRYCNFQKMTVFEKLCEILGCF